VPTLGVSLLAVFRLAGDRPDSPNPQAPKDATTASRAYYFSAADSGGVALRPRIPGRGVLAGCGETRGL